MKHNGFKWSPLHSTHRHLISQRHSNPFCILHLLARHKTHQSTSIHPPRLVTLTASYLLSMICSSFHSLLMYSTNTPPPRNKTTLAATKTGITLKVDLTDNASDRWQSFYWKSLCAWADVVISSEEKWSKIRVEAQISSQKQQSSEHNLRNNKSMRSDVCGRFGERWVFLKYVLY